MGLRLHLAADGFDLAKDAQQISAENFLDLIGAVPAIQQSLCNLRQVGGRIHALRRCAADAIEIGADTDMIDARDLGDVIDL